MRRKNLVLPCSRLGQPWTLVVVLLLREQLLLKLLL